MSANCVQRRSMLRDAVIVLLALLVALVWSEWLWQLLR